LRVATLVLPLLLIGCGSAGPRLERSDAAPLIALTHRIAHERGCAQGRDARALRVEATRIVNTGRVPAELLEPLSSAVNVLVADTATCVGSPTHDPTREARDLEDWLKAKSR